MTNLNQHQVNYLDMEYFLLKFSLNIESKIKLRGNQFQHCVPSSVDLIRTSTLLKDTKTKKLFLIVQFLSWFYSKVQGLGLPCGKELHSYRRAF